MTAFLPRRRRGLGAGSSNDLVLPGEGGERLVHVVNGAGATAAWSWLGDPVGGEVIVVLTERVDHLLLHLRRP